MSTIFAINAQAREKSGKSAARQLRDNGKLPAIIYGKNEKNHSIAIDAKSVTQNFLKGGFYTRVCEITLNGKVIKAIPKAVTLHPVTDNLEHVDFFILNDKEKVKIKVGISFVNEEKCIGVKKGGVLNIAARYIEILCYPKDITNKITVDLANLNMGESIHVNNIDLPENAEVSKKSQGQTIVTLVGKMQETTAATEDQSEESGEEQADKKAEENKKSE